jgi:hypothetical protein
VSQVMKLCVCVEMCVCGHSCLSLCAFDTVALTALLEVDGCRGHSTSLSRRRLMASAQGPMVEV